MDNIETVNKMQACRTIMRELIKDESIDKAKRRKPFISRVTSELAMSYAAASSYYNIIKNAMVDGKDGYAAHKRANKRANSKNKSVSPQVTADVEVVAPVEVVAQVEQPSETTVTERWQIQDCITNEIIEAFTSRSAAQAAAKERKSAGENVRWVDSAKKTG